MVALQSCAEIGSRRRDQLKASIRTFACDELDEIIALDNILMPIARCEAAPIKASGVIAEKLHSGCAGF